jgi:single-stranded-DNA-specific exonuclease
MATPISDSAIRLPSIAKRWHLLPQEAACARTLAESRGLHPVVARILAARGWRAEDNGTLDDFLNPRLAAVRDPFELDGMEAAVARALAAVRDGQRICVFGDYDADGVCATAVMVLALRRLGADPLIVIPNRISDGYGVSPALVREAARAGVKLMITVDTGVTAVREVELAASLGMDVVVTDHHIAGAELPPAVALVNPNLAGSGWKGGPLCGAGVAFKFAHALLRRAQPQSASAKEFLRGLLDLVALATVADAVPLHGENRIIARHGLAQLAESTRPGIRALFEVSQHRGRAVSSETVGFVLAPRLNAPSRTEGDARLALRLLLSEDATEALEVARQLDTLNRERRMIERGILDECVNRLDREGASSSALVIAGEGWHPGVVGTVAARLTERYHRPAVVLTLDTTTAKGSARSIPGYDIHAALSSCSSHLVQFGGHAAAAGVQLLRESLPAFREALASHATGEFAAAAPQPTVTIDTEVMPDEVDAPCHQAIQRLQPFGEGNRAPALMVRNARVTSPPRTVAERHLRVNVQLGHRTFGGIGFSMAQDADQWQPGMMRDLVFRTAESRGPGSCLELEIVASRESGSAPVGGTA